MRVLLLGKTGQAGWELQRTLAPLGPLIALDYPEIDYTHPDSLPALVEQTLPDVIVNAVAYTAVDQAEKEPEIARALNTTSPGVLAEAARRHHAAFIHYSTDYVFDGTKGTPYVETDTPNPMGIYAQSKYAGELAVQEAGGAYLVLRTSWMYSLRGKDFVSKVLQWSRQQPTLKFASDQTGSPTWARMLAEITALALAGGNADVYTWAEEKTGVYHLAGSGCASRLELAQSVLELDPRKEEQVVQEILEARMEDFPAPAPRPLNTSLDCSLFTQAFGLQLPDWGEALGLAMERA